MVGETLNTYTEIFQDSASSIWFINSLNADVKMSLTASGCTRKMKTYYIYIIFGGSVHLYIPINCASVTLVRVIDRSQTGQMKKTTAPEHTS